MYLGPSSTNNATASARQQPVTRLDSVLLVQADFVFVAQCHGNAALRPGRGGITQIRLGENQNAAGFAEFDGGA